MIDFLDFIKRAIYPESFGDIIVCSIVILVFSYGPVFKFWGKSLKYGLTRTFFVSLSASLIYIFVLSYLIPHVNQFQDGKCGILIPQFTGSRLDETFDNTKLNKVLETHLNEYLHYNQLDSYVTAKSISRIINNHHEARRFKSKYNAQIILWSEVANLGNIADFAMNLDLGTIVFVCNTPNNSESEFAFTLETDANFRLELNNNYNMDDIVKEIIDHSLPIIIAMLSTNNTELTDNLLMDLPRKQFSTLFIDLMPFLYQQIGSAYEREGKFDTAMLMYSNSYHKFEDMILSLDSGKVIGDLDESIIRRFAAVSKWEESICALNLGDTIRSLSCLAMSTYTDSSFLQPFTNQYLYLKPPDSDSIRDSFKIDLSSPFLKDYTGSIRKLNWSGGPRL